MTAVGLSRRIDAASAVAICPLHLRQRLNFRTAAKRRDVPQAAVSNRSNVRVCVAPPGGLGVRLSLSSYCDTPPIAKDRIT